METVSTKVPTPMKEKLDEMAEEIGESRSIVIRDILRDALNEEDTAERSSFSFLFFVAFIGWTMFAAGFLDAETTVGLGGLALAVGALAMNHFDLFNRD